VSRVSGIVPEFVETFPTPLQPGVLYISASYSTAAHLCCCGCRREVITPLSPAQWVVTFDGEVSLRPSIGNWALPCRSHYVIHRGQIRWAQSYSDAEIKQNREDDRRLLTETRPEQPTWLTRVVRRLRSRPPRS
jgi:uncharacterized protein DUF6527